MAITIAICLKGYPHPIVSVLETDKPVECRDAADDEFNNRLTTFTVQEILEDDELIKSKTPSNSGAKDEDS